MARKKTIRISRRDFLKMSGTGLTGAVLLGAAGCDGGEQIQGGRGGNTFVFGRRADSICLDPINATDDESFRVTRQIFEPLLDFAPGTFDLVPALATEVPEAEDGGKSYTLNLRRGVKFHDGAEFNAEAVVFNFDRWRDTKNPYHKGGGAQSKDFSYYTGQFGGFDGDSIITNVEAVDGYTVRFTLEEPQGPFLRNLTMGPFAIASPKAIKDNVDDFWKNPVGGTGPYKFVKWERNSEVELEENDDWWGSDVPEKQGGGGPKIPKVVIRSIPDNTSRVAALTGGELSCADGLLPDDVPTVREQGIKVEFRPPNTIGYLAMNNQKKPFDNPKVRQAINMAIDMPSLVQSALGDTGKVASSYIPSLLPYFNPSVERYPHDPDRAKQLLKEAGAENLNTELWYMPIPRPYMPNAKSMAQIMQQDLKKVGVNAKLVTYEWGTYLDKTGSGQHPMCLLGWTGDNGDPDNFLYRLLSSPSATPSDALNVAYYKNPELDKLLKQAQTTVNRNERQNAYYRAQEILMRDAPWMPIAYVKPPLGVREQVKGFVPNPVSSEAFNPVSFGGGK